MERNEKSILVSNNSQTKVLSFPLNFVIKSSGNSWKKKSTAELRQLLLEQKKLISNK